MSPASPGAGSEERPAGPGPAGWRAGATRAAAGALLQAAALGQADGAGPHLVVCEPGATERLHALGDELLVGRADEAGLRLLDQGASRRHARIRLDAEGRATIEDLGSKNGLELNGRRAIGPPARLAPGDVITIGRTSLRFQDPLAAVGDGPDPAGEAGAGTLAADEGPEPGAPWRRRALDPGGLLWTAAALLAAAAVLLGL